MLSVLAWQITTTWVVEITFLQFIFIEILIAIFELLSIFAVNKAEGKTTDLLSENHHVQPTENGED